jgi:hypothetical protein
MLEYLQTILIIVLLPTAILIKEYKSPNSVLILLMMYAYHLFFSYAYYHIPTDGEGIYQLITGGFRTVSLTQVPSPGNNFIFYLTRICIEYLNLSYLGATLLFGSLSYIGFWILFRIIQAHKIQYLWLVLLIPSMHFWTSGFGKDSLSFLFISTLLYGVLKNKLHYMILSLVVIFLIRPHIALLFGLLYILTAIFNPNISLRIKLIGSIVILGLVVPTLNILYAYLGINNLFGLYDFALIMQKQNLYGGSSIDISEYSLPLQVFTYLFRPFFENQKLVYMLVSFDNLIYLLIFLWVVINKKFINFKDPVNIYLIITFLIFSTIMGFTIANLGLALRQKIMIMPFLLLIFTQAMSRKKLIANSK